MASRSSRIVVSFAQRAAHVTRESARPTQQARRPRCCSLRTETASENENLATTGGERKATLLRTCATEREAIRRKLAIAKLVARLRETGHRAMCANLIRDAGGLDDEGFKKLVRLVERVASGKEPGLARRLGVRREGTTVKELADLWTSGDLAKEYPDHVKVKKTSAGDARIFAWLGKVRLPDGSTFGDRAVATVTLDDCDHVMGALPKTAETPATRRQYAQSLRKLLVYAVYPLRLLPTLPIPKGWLPKARSDKAKVWIYPSEDLALMRCHKVPLARRLFYGVLAREGLRVGEAFSLTWHDVDLDHGVLRLEGNKTDDPRSWAMGEDVARALDAWRRLRGTKAKRTLHVFPRALVCDRWALAQNLREGLALAGVKRPELTTRKKGHMRLRAHDLRGSFVTLALAAGRTEAWVTDRTGHRSSQMIYLYKRAARTASELGLGWFAPLDEAIPELAPKRCQGANGVQTGRPATRETSRRGSKTSDNLHLTTRRARGSDALNPLADGSSPSWPTP
jgi:integrase